MKQKYASSLIKYRYQIFDLSDIARNCGQKFKNKRPEEYSKFGEDIIGMAETALDECYEAPPFNETYLDAVTACVKTLIGKTQWRDHLYDIPLPFKHELFYSSRPGNDYEREFVNKLAYSVVMSLVACRIDKRENSPNLTKHISQVIIGYEWICYWFHNSIPLTPEENDLIAYLDNRKIAEHIEYEYIVGESTGISEIWKT